ncbi:hypothetical protein ABID59_000150 [Bradyrhizobium sp. S3.3.6]
MMASAKVGVAETRTIGMTDTKGSSAEDLPFARRPSNTRSLGVLLRRSDYERNTAIKVLGGPLQGDIL